MNKDHRWSSAVLALFLVLELGWIAWAVHGRKLLDYYAYDVASVAVSRGLDPGRTTPDGRSGIEKGYDGWDGLRKQSCECR
jgi:hypothetical protein